MRAITALEEHRAGTGRVAIHDFAARIPGLEEHVLVVAAKRRPTPLGVPREAARRRRHPW